MTIETHIKPAPLSALERNKLETAERVIAESMKTFVEVGEALATIRNDKLYRDTHHTFEDYCQERWGWTSGRARQLVSAANIAAEVKSATTVSLPNERTARAVAQVPPAQRVEVVTKAAESGPVSSVTIARAAEQIAKGPPPPKKTMKAEPLIDPAGREYSHPKVMEALGQTTEFDKLKAAVHSLKREVLALAERPVGKHLNASQIKLDFENIATAIRHAVPHTTCPYAPAHGDRGCELCGGSMWITEQQFKRVPEEDR